MKKQLFAGLVFLSLFAFSAPCLFAAAVVGDYDGDGKTDIMVRRLETMRGGRYYWYSLNSRDNSFTATQWGYVPYDIPRDDIPILEDFDGDGKTDFAVRRSSFVSYTSPTYFYILRSSDNTFYGIQWGVTGDQAMVQDYDGDGQADIAVVRGAGTGVIWYIVGSRRGYFTVYNPEYGEPTRGDFDGDGKADYAVYYADREYKYHFYIMKSSTMQIETMQFGDRYGDQVVPGDYDGDGKADIAICRCAGDYTVSGYWIWLRSSDGQVETVRFGTGVALGDYPIPGDYDGDGKTDPAFYRRGYNFTTDASYFYILKSRDGFYGVQWGQGTDSPPIYRNLPAR